MEALQVKRIGKIESTACWYCEEGLEENVEYAIFECDGWARVRKECEVELEKRVNADNMVDLMPKNEEGWMAIERMLVTVMKMKCEYQRERERERKEEE